MKQYFFSVYYAMSASKDIRPTNLVNLAARRRSDQQINKENMRGINGV